MSNTRRIKRPFKQIGPKNPTTEQMAALLAGQSGLFMINVQHDDWCPVPTTKREEQCICNPDHRLLKFDPSITEGK